MPILSITALILVALAGAGFVVARDERAALGTFLAQWLGLVCAGVGLDATGGAFGLSRESAVELVTAIVCGLIFWLTLRSLRTSPGIAHGASQVVVADYLLPGATVLLGGFAGVGFANLFPFATPESDLAFYWAVMAGALALVLDGARSLVKLSAGLFVLLNATALLVHALSVTPPSSALLGLMAAARIGIAVVMAYGWLLNARLFKDMSLGPLFNTRDETQGATTALQPQVEGGVNASAGDKSKVVAPKPRSRKKGRGRSE